MQGPSEAFISKVSNALRASSLGACSAQFSDVAVDLQADSPNYGRWISTVPAPAENNQHWIPTGFGHAFCSLEPNSVISYRVTNYYGLEDSKRVVWNDPDIPIDWPELVDSSTLSPKDRTQPLLAELPPYFSMKGK